MLKTPNARPVLNQILLQTNLDTNANMIEEKIYASTYLSDITCLLFSMRYEIIKRNGKLELWTLAEMIGYI